MYATTIQFRFHLVGISAVQCVFFFVFVGEDRRQCITHSTSTYLFVETVIKTENSAAKSVVFSDVVFVFKKGHNCS